MALSLYKNYALSLSFKNLGDTEKLVKKVQEISSQMSDKKEEPETRKTAKT
jgi:hypothetical protein